MIELIRNHVLAGSKKNATAPYIFIVMFIYAMFITGQAIVSYDMETILIRAGACIGILVAFTVFERSSLSVTIVSFLSPLSIIVLIAFATFDGDGGALLIFLHIIATTMVSFTYMKPVGVALFVATVSVASISILAIFNVNILGEHFTMIHNYLYLAITLALNVLLYFFCKSHSDTISELINAKNETSKAAEAKGVFLSNMSHEIRTPITVVLGVSEIELQRHNIPPETEDSFTRIHNSAKLLLRLINDILDFSKLEGGKVSIHHEEYETAGLINAIAHPYYTHLQGKDIKFNLNLEENLPALLVGDALRIEQIVMNLLSNAFNYTAKGSVDLYINFKPHNDEYITLVFSVCDTGVGMTEEQLATVFNEYARFHEHLKNNVNGTGLGMSIVQKLTLLMDGHIEMESEVGKGTTVTICIPQKVSGTEVLNKEAILRLQQFEMLIQSDSQKNKFTPEPMPYGSVLVVDDVDTNLHVAKGLLNLYSLKVETCSSGQDAIAKIKSGKSYDIIFMDYMMPEMNGIKAMQIMREMGYIQPIVVLTANALIGLREEYVQNGFDDFLSKPIITSRLNDILVKYIRDKQPPEVIEAAKNSSSISQKTIDDFQNSDDLLNKIRADFVRDRKNIVLDIEQSINADDMDTAHRLAHTLKGLSATMKEFSLSKAAQAVEEIIEKEKAPQGDEMLILKQEFNRVIKSFENLKPVSNKENSGIVELLNKIKPLLEQRKAQCMEFTKELSAIPEATILTRQIEKMDFASALKSLNVLLDIYAS